MTIPIDPTLVARLSGEFTALADDFTGLGGRMSTLGRDLETLHRHVLSAVPAHAEPAGGSGDPAPEPDCGRATESRAPSPDSATGRAAPAKTPVSPGTAPGVPATGVRVGGVHTPDTAGGGAPRARGGAPPRAGWAPPPGGFWCLGGPAAPRPGGAPPPRSR